MNPHERHSASPGKLIASVYLHRQLIIQLIKREIIGRYRGSLLGIAWVFFHPVMMITVYTFIFGIIFKARWGLGGSEDNVSFALVLFAGLIIFNFFAECVNRAPSLILNHPSYVKKVVFPLEILPCVILGGALFHAFISLLIFIVFSLFLQVSFSWTFMLVPLVILPLVLATLGAVWFLASLGVFMRDIAQVTGFATTVLLFLSPVFYSVSALPEKYHVWLYMNPLTFILEESRKVIFMKTLPAWPSLGISYAVGLLLAWIGFWFFQKTRRGFADVI